MNAHPLFEPAGRTAFVAGAYGGLGEAIARALAETGVAVALGGRDASKLTALAASIAASGGKASAHAFDAGDVPSIRAAVADAASAMGGIDLLVNSLGLFEEERLLDATPESFDRVTAINYRAAMFLGQAVARAQVAAARGGRPNWRQTHACTPQTQLQQFATQQPFNPCAHRAGLFSTSHE